MLVSNGCVTKVEYVDKPYEVLVPIKCVVPDTHCDFNQTTYTQVIYSMITCIEDFKKNAEVCK